jgi:hypothetical protein
MGFVHTTVGTNLHLRIRAASAGTVGSVHSETGANSKLNNGVGSDSARGGLNSRGRNKYFLRGTGKNKANKSIGSICRACTLDLPGIAGPSIKQ